MMQTIFRVILVIVSFMTVAFMMRRIRQAKVQIEAALFWVALSAILFVFAVFPPLAEAQHPSEAKKVLMPSLGRSARVFTQPSSG